MAIEDIINEVLEEYPEISDEDLVAIVNKIVNG